MCGLGSLTNNWLSCPLEGTAMGCEDLETACLRTMQSEHWRHGSEKEWLTGVNRTESLHFWIFINRVQANQGQTTMWRRFLCQHQIRGSKALPSHHSSSFISWLALKIFILLLANNHGIIGLEGTQSNFLMDARLHLYVPRSLFQVGVQSVALQSLALLNDLRVLSIYPWVTFNNPRDFSVFLFPDSYFLPGACGSLARGRGVAWISITQPSLQSAMSWWNFYCS